MSLTPTTSNATGGQSADQSNILAAIQRMEQNFTSSLNAVSACVDELSERVHGAPTLFTDLPPLPRWPYDEDDEETGLRHSEPFEVSESTSALLKKSFTSTLPHVERHKLRRMFHVPNVEKTKCPRLDSFFMTAGSSLRGEAKAFEQDLARVQAFVLNPIEPLVQLLEACQSGTLQQDEAISTLYSAITLLGDASSQISKLRRKKKS